MQLFAVLVRPVAHSLSPEMMRVAFAETGIDGEYLRIDCGEEELPRIADLVRQGILKGVNITVPHKLTAFDLADERSEVAERLGAANTWLAEDGRLTAHNTDGAGFLSALRDHTIHREQVLILGAGGAARAIALGLSDHPVTVAARDPLKAKPIFEPLGATAIPWEEAARHLPAAGLVVNATTIGMAPDTSMPPGIDLGNCLPGTVVYDIVYRPLMTTFLKSASAYGLPTIGGAEMLVGQGAAAFELWFRTPAPISAMRLAVEKLLD